MGRELRRSSHPTRLLKEGRIEPIAQDHVQTAFEYLQGGRLTTSLGNLCQCLVTLTVKECFLMCGWNLLHFSWCPLPLALSLGKTKESLAPSSLHPPFKYSYN